MGLLDWLMRRQVDRGQRHFDRALPSLSDAELLNLLDRSQFDGAVRLEPSRGPAVDAFLARVAARDFARLADELSSGALDPGEWFYAPSWTGPRPFDYRHHYGAICRELARRGR